MIAKIFLLGSTMLLAPIAFPTGIVLCWFYFYLFTVNGTLGYFSGIGIFKWIPYVLGGMLLVKGLLLLKGSVKFTSVHLEERGLTSHLVTLVLIWMAFSLATSMINSISLIQFIVGVKQYILMWGVFVLFAVTNIPALYLEKIWRIFLLVVVIQVPVILIQFVFFAGSRLQGGSEGKNDAAWDSIVGTFGGNAFGGGNSAGLAFFAVLMLIFGLALKKQRLISMLYFTVIMASLFCVMMLAEIKVIFIMLPVGLLLLYRADLIRKPLKSIVGVIVFCILASFVFSNYQAQYYSSGKDLTTQETIDEMLETVVADDVIIDETGEMGRLTSLVFWWNENINRYGAINTLIGHGMLASRSVSLFLAGNLASDYALHLDANGLAILLWDFGLLGVLIYFSLLFYGAFLSFRLSKNNLVPCFHRVALETGAIGLLLTTIAIAHHPSPIVMAVSQSMMIFFLGQCIYWQRNLLNKNNSDYYNERIHEG